MNENRFFKLLNEYVYVSTPIRDPRHLKGRSKELKDISNCLRTMGQLPFVYGLRGVGKSSIALTAAINIFSNDPHYVVCDSSMRFEDIIQSIIDLHTRKDITAAHIEVESQIDGSVKIGGSGVGGSRVERKSFTNTLGPLNVQQACVILASIKLEDRCIVVDEFDQIKDNDTRYKCALLAKALSDSNNNTKIIFCGVANDLSDLFDRHESASRYLRPIEVRKLDYGAIEAVIKDIEQAFGIEFEINSARRIIQISDGFPYFVHSIARETLQCWFDDGAEFKRTTPDQYERGILRASDTAEPELRKIYDLATMKYKRDGEYICWALADGPSIYKQRTKFYSDYKEIWERAAGVCDKIDDMPKMLSLDQFSARLTHLIKPEFGALMFRPTKSYYELTEKRMRGYARLRAATQRVYLKPDHPLASRQS